MTTLREPRRWKGYWDMGLCLSRHIQIPWGLTDRGDGTVWYVTASTTDGTQRVALDTTQPASGPTRPKVYAAYDEPFLGSSNLRIFVRDGHLGFEVMDTHIYSGPRWTLPRLSDPFDTRYELKTPAGFDPSADPLAFETVVEF